MHNIVRAFVVVLALTGAVTFNQNSSAATQTGIIHAAKTSAMPTPMCPLDDPNACGIANH